MQYPGPPHLFMPERRRHPNSALPGTPARRLICLALSAALFLGLVAAAGGQDLQSQLQSNQGKLDHATARDGVLTTTVERYSKRIDSLTAEVSQLREREANVQVELDAAQARLESAVAQLGLLQGHLDRAVQALGNRLVQIYKTGEPDTITLLLSSDGYDDLVTRSAYLGRINASSSALVGRVRDLRDQTQATVTEVQTERDQIAARKAELAQTRGDLERRRGELSSARQKNRATLSRVRSLEGDLSDHVRKLQDQIASQLQAAAGPTIAPGPIRGGANGLIWPVDGVITSPFGPRWGSFHPGLDIGAPEGTPIRAAKAGRVVLAAPNGGYGNFTCLDHGGGLQTCYAHQSKIGTSAGASVAQGQVIGYVGSTGFSTGPHLHFEVRITGTAVDPLNYL